MPGAAQMIINTPTQNSAVSETQRSAEVTQQMYTESVWVQQTYGVCVWVLPGVSRQVSD